MPSPRSTTSDLVARAQGGDFTALDALFERHYEAIRKYTRLRMGEELQAYERSSDIVQGALVTAALIFDRFKARGKGSFRRWVARIVENQIKGRLDYHHAQKRDRRREQALQHVRSSMASGSLAFEPAAEIPLPEEILLNRESAERVEECLQRLTAEQRDAILLRRVLGTSYEEIAEVLGKNSPSAARQFVVRAEAALLTLLRHLGEGDSAAT